MWKKAKNSVILWSFLIKISKIQGLWTSVKSYMLQVR